MISKNIEYREFFFLQLILKKVKLSYFTFITCKEKHFKRFLSENCQKPSQRSSSASSSSSSGSRPDCSSSSLPTWEGKYSNSMASGTLERCSLHRWIPIFTVQGRWQTACMALCGWAVCWCQRCGSSGPWWRWGYGMGRLWLWTTNTLLMTFECTVTWSWGPLLCHSSTAITSFCSMIMHSPMLQRSVHNSWKLKTSQFLHGQHSPDMSPIEHVWDALDRHIRHRVPVPDNIQQLRTTIEEEWTNIPQATINNLINSMQRRCVALHKANGGHTRFWLVFRVYI